MVVEDPSLHSISPASSLDVDACRLSIPSPPTLAGLGLPSEPLPRYDSINAKLDPDGSHVFCLLFCSEEKRMASFPAFSHHHGYAPGERIPGNSNCMHLVPEDSLPWRAGDAFLACCYVRAVVYGGGMYEMCTLRQVCRCPFRL